MNIKLPANRFVTYYTSWILKVQIMKDQNVCHKHDITNRDYLVTCKYWCKKLILRTCCYFTYCKTRRYNWWFKEYVNSSTVTILSLFFFWVFFQFTCPYIIFVYDFQYSQTILFFNQSFVFTGYKMCDNLMIVFALPVLCFVHLVCA